MAYSNPFGQSLRGGYRSAQPNVQQPSQPQNFGGEDGYGGYNNFGGFQPQQSFGGFGGGFGGYGGGFNPMFGGLGGLGFNPMMGPQFMQPMPFFGGFGGYGGGFGGGMPMGYGGFGGFGGFSPYQQPQFGGNPMFGGLGGLGYNPMMGGQFMQPMQPPQQQYSPRFNSRQSMYGAPKDMRYRGGPQRAPDMQQSREQDMRAFAETGEGVPMPSPQVPPSAVLTPTPVEVPSSGLSIDRFEQMQMPMIENTGVKGVDPEQQYQQDLQRMQQQPTVNLGGKSMQDWQSEYNQMYNPNRMTMDMAPSLDKFIQRRTNPINFPGMPGFAL